MQNIECIDIDSNWFYRRLTPEQLYEFVRSKGILSARKLSKKNNTECISYGWNGVDYISLSRRIKNISMSSYQFFNKGNYSIIINTDKAKKTHCINVPLSIANLPISIRFSIWKDEYQVKDSIPLEDMIGIKIPEKSITPLNIYLKQLSYYLSIMEETDFYLPFIDIEEKKKISDTKVKEYLKNKHYG